MTRTCILLFSLLICANGLLAQQQIDARAAGMAFSTAASARGLSSVGVNPAALGLKTPYNYELNLFSGIGGFNNNSFTKDQYDRYFTTGDELFDADIEDILNSIDEEGVRADVDGRATALAIYAGNISLSFFAQGTGYLNIPKAAFELPLQGNSGTGRVYDFDNADGNGWIGFGMKMGGGLPLPVENVSWLDEMALGLNLTLFSAEEYGGIEKGTGRLEDYDLTNNQPFINVDAELNTRESAGGRGLGVDAGFIMVVSKKLTFGVALNNAFSQVSWTERNEKRIFILSADSLSLPNRVSDSLVTQTDSTFLIDDFDTNLPRVLDVALGFQPNEKVNLSVEYEQGFDKNMGGTKKPRLGIGVEVCPIKQVPLRAGLSMGGKTGTSLALGLGLDLKYWILDVAFLNHAGSVLIPSKESKGITLAATTRFRF
ncbi:MAG: hypothetical protein ACRBF0_17690 [Calditrichia bacterium]